MKIITYLFILLVIFTIPLFSFVGYTAHAIPPLDSESIYESSAIIVQYLGTTTIDGVDYFLTWHAIIEPEDRFECKYPQIIQHSLKHNFREL